MPEGKAVPIEAKPEVKAETAETKRPEAPPAAVEVPPVTKSGESKPAKVVVRPELPATESTAVKEAAPEEPVKIEPAAGPVAEPVTKLAVGPAVKPETPSAAMRPTSLIAEDPSGNFVRFEVGKPFYFVDPNTGQRWTHITRGVNPATSCIIQKDGEEYKAGQYYASLEDARAASKAIFDKRFEAANILGKGEA